MPDARRLVERVAREAYGRLVALLAARSRDIAGAEDALADAFAAALAHWPVEGVPDRPEAWLLAAARRRMIDAGRRRRTREAAVPALLLALEEAGDAEVARDERPALLFVCAHPAIDPAARAPLMLQAVLGLDAARIAGAWRVAPAAMAQRLVRAKARIRDAGIGWRVPEADELPVRLADVLDAIYAAYGIGWDAAQPLAEEALWLARLVAALLPDEPEALGLLALLLHCEARRDARRDAQGRFLPLDAQDPRRWNAAMRSEAEALLRRAAGLGRIGRYQLEGAIQSVHAARAGSGRTDWDAVITLYDALATLAPVLGALVARAAAVSARDGAAAGLAALDAIDGGDYQPYWVLRARLLRALDAPGAAAARERALALTRAPHLEAHLRDTLADP